MSLSIPHFRILFLWAWPPERVSSFQFLILGYSSNVLRYLRSVRSYFQFLILGYLAKAELTVEQTIFQFLILGYRTTQSMQGYTCTTFNNSFEDIKDVVSW